MQVRISSLKMLVLLSATVISLWEKRSLRESRGKTFIKHELNVASAKNVLSLRFAERIRI